MSLYIPLSTRDHNHREGDMEFEHCDQPSRRQTIDRDEQRELEVIMVVRDLVRLPDVHAFQRALTKAARSALRDGHPRWAHI